MSRTCPGKKYEIPNPLNTLKCLKMKQPTCVIPGKSLPNPSLFATWAWHQARPDELALSIYLQRKYKNQYNSISIFSSSFFCMNKQKKKEHKECKVPNRNASKGHKMHAESNDYIGKIRPNGKNLSGKDSTKNFYCNQIFVWSINH